MNVTGSNNRLVKLFTKLYNLFVDLNQILFRMNRVILFILHHEHIVPKGLDFQIIIKAYQSCDFLLRCIAQKSLVKLTSLAGTSNKKSLPMCLKHALWHTGSVVKILDMRLAYQLVQIDTAGLISHENNGMVSGQLLNGVRGNLSLLIQLVYIRNISFPAHFHKFLENTCRTLCVINRTMVMIQGNANCLGNGIQLKTVQRRQQESCHTYRIHIGEIIWDSHTVTILYNKTHIEICVVGYHCSSFTKFQKFR